MSRAPRMATLYPCEAITMVPHDKETPTFTYDLATERDALRATKRHRKIPAKTASKVLTATWNLTNFGFQKRTDNDLALMAEVMSWFDLISIQEIADDLTTLGALMGHLGAKYKVVLSDTAGNDERAGFLYNSRKLERLEVAAEVAVPPSAHRHIRMKGVSGSFSGFDRNPYLVAFRSKNLTFIAVSAHLFFGSHSYKDEDRRALEAYALARWASLKNKGAGAYSENILIMGDLNLPKKDDSSPVFRALKKKGLMLPEHSTQIGSSLKDDKDYDQIMFHAGGMKKAYTGKSGVFDFDRAPFFSSAWSRSEAYFGKTLKRHIADHRPLWAEFNI